jgi:CTP synthase
MRRIPHKYIFVVGGVMSGVGKGIATSSIGTILKARGFKVTSIKIDPYINIDAGTMNPTEHGEVFVLKDGDETDQDMGNYERFLGEDLSRANYMTTGRVYQSVIDRERNLSYRGKCVEVVPHIPLEVIGRIKKAATLNKADITIIEVGGTIGEYQNILFIEAVRMMKLEHSSDVAVVMLSYLPIPANIGEMKTKPTQYAVRTLNSNGVHPDFIIARGEQALDAKRKEKLALFCNIPQDRIVSAPNVESIYEVPLLYEKDKLGDTILKTLSLTTRRKPNLEEWKKFVRRIQTPTKDVKIAIVGKYFDTGDFVLSDAYLSVIEALKFSGAQLFVKPKISWVNSKDIERKGAANMLRGFDGVIVPGGFGETGIEGKILAAKYCRERRVPYFGLCYGLHMLLIEYARNVLKLKGAHTVEIDPKTPHPVIDFIPEQRKLVKDGKYGGTMRLGIYPADLKEGTIAHSAYRTARIMERHRHRYEVNPDYIERFEKRGIIFSGHSPNGVLMEVAELSKKVHPFMLGTQFHPELQARPLSPHPLFTAFLKASMRAK